MTAVLITGSTDLAEAAIHVTIDSLANDADLDHFAELTTDAALCLNRTSSWHPSNVKSYDLPEELLRVVRLPSKLRSAFVSIPAVENTLRTMC